MDSFYRVLGSMTTLRHVEVRTPDGDRHCIPFPESFGRNLRQITGIRLNAFTPDLLSIIRSLSNHRSLEFVSLCVPTNFYDFGEVLAFTVPILRTMQSLARFELSRLEGLFDDVLDIFRDDDDDDDDPFDLDEVISLDDAHCLGELLALPISL